MPKVATAIRAADTLTDLLDIDSVGVRVVLDIRGSLPMSDDTRRAIQAVELALQEELWCPVMLRLGVGLHTG